jgi:tRNA(Ile)-lysidine synthase TilS/MesJ
VPYVLKKTDIKQVVFDIRQESNPCSLCAKLRRGSLNDAAKELGCNKVALGHHFDDAVETFMMSLLYEGRISCFLPVTYLDRTDLTVIRPMLYMTERQVVGFARRQELPIVPSGCPVDKQTKREETKALIRDLEKKYPGLRERVFGAMQRYPLQGWEKTPWERE